jgi:hypothetical protein
VDLQTKIKREVVRVNLKGPLYFTIPLQTRLQFIKFLSQEPVFNAIYDPQIRGHLKPSPKTLLEHMQIICAFLLSG